MTNTSKFFSDDDPRLTAFALGELEGEELAAVEAALRDDPAARATVEQIRATAAQLESALGAEAAADLVSAAPALDRVAIVPGKDPAKLDGGTAGELIRFPRLKFPQLYYLVGGLAAAAFAILVVRREPPARPMAEHAKRTYTEVALEPVPAAADARNEADVSGRSQAVDALTAAKVAEVAQAQEKKRDDKALVVALPTPQAPAQNNAPVQNYVLKPQLDAQVVQTIQSTNSNERRISEQNVAGKLQAERQKAGAPVAVADAAREAGIPAGKDEELAAVANTPVFADKDRAEVATGAASPTRVGMEVQRNALMAAPARPEPSSTVLGPVSGGALAKEETAQTLAQFSVSSEGSHASPERRHAGRDIGMIEVAPKGEYRGFGQRSGDGTLEAGQFSPSTAGGKTKANTESYAYQRDNDFLGALQNPLSTFSVDVDTASYATVRRFLAEGQRPPVDAVRIEELVNYFPYAYAPPSMQDDAVKVPFAASLEVADAPWAAGHRLVRIGLKGREVSTAERPAANLVFLLDVSGSMDEPNKLPLVKESMRLLVGKLRPDDRVAIVVYAGASGLALPSTPVAQAPKILEALAELTPGGSTNGAMGIQLAYDVAKANFVTGGLNRVILCTDGDFNVGVTNEGDLTRLVAEKAKSGVFLTVLGFGMGNYKDSTLEKLADQGNGNYGYVDTRREAEKLLVEQVNGTLLTIAKDVKLQVEFNPAQVASYRLIGYEDRLLKKEDFNNDAVDAGEIGAGHTVTALYEIVPISQVMGQGSGAMGVPAVDELKYGAVSNQQSAVSQADRKAESRKLNADRSVNSELLTLKVRYKEPAGAVSRKLEFPLIDGGARFATASADFKFAAAVAEFGMILRDSPHKGNGTLQDVRAWAQAGAGNDPGGYRGEFIQLVKQAEAVLQ